MDIQGTVFALFPTPVYSGIVEDITSFNDMLEPYIEQIRKDKNLDNPWGDNTKTSFKFGQPDGHQIKDDMFVNEIQKHITHYCSTIANTLIPDLSYNWIESWVNYSNRGDYQHYHLHPVSDISGIYYYKAESQSSLMFENPNIVLESSKFPFHLCGVRQESGFNPKTGDLILFPSWLRHAVFENKSDQERISIAFNIELDR